MVVAAVPVTNEQPEIPGEVKENEDVNKDEDDENDKDD